MVVRGYENLNMYPYYPLLTIDCTVVVEYALKPTLVCLLIVQPER